MKNEVRLVWKQLPWKQRVIMACALLIMACALLLIILGFVSLLTNIYLFLIVFDVVSGMIVALGVVMVALAIANRKRVREKNNEQEQLASR